MRFKTKSGVTISNNTVQKRLQEEALKRSKEAEEQQQQQVPVIKQPLEDDSVIGKFLKPQPPLPQLKRPQEIHTAYNHYYQDSQETFSHQEIHAENLGEIHAVQEMQVFENSITEESLSSSLPKIKNIYSSASIEKPKTSKSKKGSRIMEDQRLKFSLQKSHFFLF